MSFQQIAIEAYEAYLEKDQAWQDERAQRFAQDATDSFRRTFLELDAERAFHPLTPRRAHLVLDGTLIEARREYGEPEFYLRVEHCFECGAAYFQSVYKLADIGEYLQNPDRCGCPLCKRRPAELAWHERLLDALREGLGSGV